MGEAIWRLLASVAWLAPLLAARAERVYQSLPRLAATPSNSRLPALSIIIPARNEATNLPRLLASLRAVSYSGPLEIIVVDDQSTDNTADIATAYNARVVRLTSLPSGVLGKPHACHQGALVAQGEWLLFTDADTIHAPHGPAAAVAYAIDHNLAGLSLFLRQACRGPVDRLALMTAFAALFAGQSHTASLMNGQYILLRRDVYQASQGFAAVWQEPLEDLALGRHLHQRGYFVPILRGEEIATVQMYQSLGQMWHGLTRLGAGGLRWTGVGGVMTTLLVTAIFTPLSVLLGVWLKRLHCGWLALTWALVALSMAPWGRRFGGAAWAILAPFGAAIIVLAGTWGGMRRLLGRGIRWKGRLV